MLLESHVTDWRKCLDDYLSEHANMPADSGARGDSPTICRRMRPSLPPSLLSSLLSYSGTPRTVASHLPSLAGRPTAAATATAAAHSHLCMLYRFSASDY